MKKNLLKSISVLMSAILLVAQTQSLSAVPNNTSITGIEESVFTFDENALETVFSELNVLDAYLEMNEGLTYSDLEAIGSDLITNVSDITAPLGAIEEGEPLAGIPGFWWGCILGWVGWLLVYLLTDKDPVQSKAAMTGCLVSSGVSVALTVLYYLVIYAAYESGY